MRAEDITAQLRRLAVPHLGNILPARGIQRFCVISVGRSGSELLVELLDAHPAIRCDGELLRTEPRLPFLLVRGSARMARRRGHAAYGFKLLSSQAGGLNHRYERLIARLVRDGFAFIHVRRRNPLRQAVSYFRAEATGEWHRRGTSAPASEPTSVDVDDLLFVISEIERHDAALCEHIEGTRHRTVWYEDQLEIPEGHQVVVDGICDLLGVASHAVTARTQKIASPDLSTELVNFDELAERLKETPYAPLLEADRDHRSR